MSHRVRHSLLILALVASAAAFVSSAGARPLADSVILFIGDGLGPGQIEMAQGAIGQPLAMQQMSFSGVVRTVSAGGHITDSAAASTALATGHKVANGTISVSTGGQPLETILERCQRRRKTVGIITNDALWGATPAGFAAHAASRGQRAKIAEQMAKSRAQVMLGYWKQEFLPASAGGKREDDKDLIAWLGEAGYQIVYTRDELLAAENRRLVGLFDDGPEAPRLADMVRAALSRLGLNADGFFLVVEHARVDWKPGDPSGVVADVLELDEAVSAALDHAKRRGRTLVVVTADHETGGLQIEKPGRLSALRSVKGTMWDIAGHLNADRSNVKEVMAEHAGISELTEQEVAQIREAERGGEAVGAVLSERAGVRWTSEGDHTATPVRVFALGPGGARFAGEMDNTEIPKRIAEVLGIGPFPGEPAR